MHWTSTPDRPYAHQSIIDTPLPRILGFRPTAVCASSHIPKDSLSFGQSLYAMAHNCCLKLKALGKLRIPGRFRPIDHWTPCATEQTMHRNSANLLASSSALQGNLESLGRVGALPRSARCCTNR